MRQVIAGLEGGQLPMNNDLRPQRNPQSIVIIMEALANNSLPSPGSS